jgi:YidC/Oxa1 family membrane protein insertase
VSVFDTLATPVAQVLKGIHAGLATVLPSGSGWTWGLSIVLLTVSVRVLLFPLFVKQIKSQRRMQELAPKIKVLQAKHKGDRETLNTELMKLYKDHGTNPISGCLPLILQLPIFFALFRVMNEFKPHFDKAGKPFFVGKYQLASDLISEGAHAKVFGAPISSAFTSSAKTLTALGGHATTVQVVSTIMIVTMGLTTFFTQRQMMSRNTTTDPQQQQIQKVMLYVLPFSFAIFGFNFPIGVLLYWLTTNVWSMGQQYYVIKRMSPVTAGGPPLKAESKALATPRTDPPTGGAVSMTKGSSSPSGSGSNGSGSNGSNSNGQGPKRAAGSRKNKSRKGGRR